MHLLLSQAGVAHGVISQRSPEVAQKGLVVELKEDAGRGAVILHPGAQRTSPRGDVAGFQCAFHPPGCPSKQPSLFPL